VEFPSVTPVTQTKAVPTFRKTAETFAAGAKTLPQRYFVSPEIFAEEPSFAKATARQGEYE
jgi:hypothetical protein